MLLHKRLLLFSPEYTGVEDCAENCDLQYKSSLYKRMLFLQEGGGYYFETAKLQI